MSQSEKASIDLRLPNPYGNEKATEKQQRKYIRYYKNAPGIVLEIGCGRGAMLTLLVEAGIPSYGLDSSDVSVRYCREKGLTVIQDDALQHLSELDASSLGGIFCAHVIEHLDPNRAIKLLHECRRVLKPGGILILITPNAKDLRITERFWLDVTHIRPYPEKLLIALLEHEGFSKIRTLENREPSRNIFERTAKFIIKIWFLGYMFRGDLVVIAEINSSAG